MIIGGIAVIAHGVQPFTADIDAAVRGDDIDVDVLVRALARRKIVPRIDRARRTSRARERPPLLAARDGVGAKRPRRGLRPPLTLAQLFHLVGPWLAREVRRLQHARGCEATPRYL
jgi:hypothetical protein